VSKTTYKNIEKARAGLILDQPFFASILLPMPLLEDPTIPTMATDGETIRYNPKWTDSLTSDEVTFVLAHETMHCVFDHMGRRGERSPNRWNQAADYIINELLTNERVGSMPHGGLLNPSLTAQGGGTAEGVYRLIPEENEGKGPGEQGGALDQVHDAGSNHGEEQPDEATKSEKSAQMKVRVIQAKNAAKMQGKLSANLERLVNDMVKPVVDWRSVLRRFVSERCKIDTTYARPKRRFMTEDFILPSLSGEKMGRIVVAVDCSGSVDQELLTKFASEINAIKQDTNPSEIEVVYFDHAVCGVDKFGPEDDFFIKARGGGGTAFSPIFRHIAKSPDEPPVATVVLTDLVCNDFGAAPDYPVLWAVLDKAIEGFDKVPFGEILEVVNTDE